MKPRRVFIALLVVGLIVLANAGGYGKHKKKHHADKGFMPPPNAIPEKYPDKYPGHTAVPVPKRSLAELPREFNWCKHPDGNNYCTPSWNQHIPKYCGSCWVHGTLGAMNDRLMYEISKRPGVPSVMLSRQDVLDCASQFGYGEGCDGGEAVDVLEYARQHGIPDESCNIYRAESSPQKCDMKKRCMNCMMLQQDNLGHCWEVPNFVKYRVKEYGYVVGEEAMMSEILARGPITCGIAVDDEFCFKYTKGVWHDKNNSSDIDHDVEVLGWGEDVDGTKYWLIRNSWGTYWGENGFFKIVRGVNMMHLEEKCYFAIMDVSELDEHLAGRQVGTMFGLIPDGQEPQLVPKNWDKLPHDYMTKKEIKKEAKEQEMIQQWIEKHGPHVPPPEILGSKAPAKALSEKDFAPHKSPSTSWMSFSTTIALVLAAVVGGFAMYIYMMKCTSRRHGYEEL